MSTGWVGGPGLNTFYFNENTDPVDGTMAADVAARVRAFFGEILGSFPSSWSGNVDSAVDRIRATDGELLGQFAVTPGSAQVGASASSNFMSSATCLIARLATDTFIGGRNVRGRHFIGPISTSAASTDGTPVGAPDWQTIFETELLVGVTDAIPVVWHRPVGGAGGVDCPIVGISQPDRFGMLRSRRD